MNVRRFLFHAACLSLTLVFIINRVTWHSHMTPNRAPRHVPTKNTHLLTLFTTFIDDSQKDYIHKKTLRNWALFGTNVTRILFMSKMSTNMTSLAKETNFLVEPVLRAHPFISPPNIYMSSTGLVPGSIEGITLNFILPSGTSGQYKIQCNALWHEI